MKKNQYLFDNVREWGRERGLDNPDAQLDKLREEVNELDEALEMGGGVPIEAGDVGVVITILADAAGYNIEECIAAAYQKIRDREGYTTSDGVFVHTGDP